MSNEDGDRQMVLLTEIRDLLKKRVEQSQQAVDAYEGQLARQQEANEIARITNENALHEQRRYNTWRLVQLWIAIALALSITIYVLWVWPRSVRAEMDALGVQAGSGVADE